MHDFVHGFLELFQHSVPLTRQEQLAGQVVHYRIYIKLASRQVLGILNMRSGFEIEFLTQFLWQGCAKYLNLLDLPLAFQWYEFLWCAWCYVNVEILKDFYTKNRSVAMQGQLRGKLYARWRFSINNTMCGNNQTTMLIFSDIGS